MLPEIYLQLFYQTTPNFRRNPFSGVLKSSTIKIFENSQRALPESDFKLYIPVSLINAVCMYEYW